MIALSEESDVEVNKIQKFNISNNNKLSYNKKDNTG